MIWPLTILLIAVPLLIVAHFEEAAKNAARFKMIDEKLSGIADALSTGFDGIAIDLDEIVGDIEELKALIAPVDGVSEGTLAKFDALVEKVAVLKGKSADVAAIVPEPVVEPPVVDPELG
jgi:expansin (peptidoglycan-binding protein)